VTQVRIGKGGRREERPKAEAGQAWYLLYCKSIKDDANLFFTWRYLFKKLGHLVVLRRVALRSHPEALCERVRAR